MGRGTLSRQLVTRICVLVAVIAVALSALGIVIVNRILTAQIDQQLAQAIGLENQSGRTSGTAGLGGLPVGSIIVIVASDGATVGTIEGVDRTQSSSTSPQINAAMTRIPTDGTTRTVTIPDLGTYRALAHKALISSREGTISGTVYLGMPMERWSHVIREFIAIEAGFTVMAIVAAAVSAMAVVRDSLRPLNQLAATATEVSKMDLDTGEVVLPERIPTGESAEDNEVGRVGLSFNRMLDNVEGALSARERSETKVKQFVADASHELRNPLAAIRGYAELSQRRGDELPPDVAFAMNRIASESRRMGRLVEDMLLLARLDAGRNVELTRVDLVEIVLNAVSDARVASRDHHWLLDVPDEPAMALADRDQMHQVVANLLSNARKHTPAGTTVTTSVRIEGEDALISVEDDGPGVPPEIRDHVFERFARADAARTHDEEGSTGLGLAIVAAVMAAHGGSARVDSHEGYSCFTLRIPVQKQDPAQSVDGAS
ncbi:two-component system, OmpR family, sensor kinase [Propionibacterium cyclohexanicum]|uniref:histidine kinase n=1 Tax=Propionibacterium cyclohexanicum TaxID=64702 RepID=A0A1H9RZ53_9ACTN|nr:HAMP domain-containing sensor histidine kinase [Propionibacterium cyclohexanicum]SER77665.1 two-component system, OmpR family, sensor kinase [Propionibacterium cyclohexanicum]